MNNYIQQLEKVEVSKCEKNCFLLSQVLENFANFLDFRHLTSFLKCLISDIRFAVLPPPSDLFQVCFGFTFSMVPALTTNYVTQGQLVVSYVGQL